MYILEIPVKQDGMHTNVKNFEHTLLLGKNGTNIDKCFVLDGIEADFVEQIERKIS